MSATGQTSASLVTNLALAPRLFPRRASSAGRENALADVLALSGRERETCLG